MRKLKCVLALLLLSLAVSCNNIPSPTIPRIGERLPSVEESALHSSLEEIVLEVDDEEEEVLIGEDRAPDVPELFLDDVVDDNAQDLAMGDITEELNEDIAEEIDPLSTITEIPLEPEIEQLQVAETPLDLEPAIDQPEPTNQAPIVEAPPLVPEPSAVQEAPAMPPLEVPAVPEVATAQAPILPVVPIIEPLEDESLAEEAAPEAETLPPIEELQPQLVQTLPQLPAREPFSLADDEIVISRTIDARVGQMVEIPFRGTGWIFLGEVDNRRGVSYDSTRVNTAAGTIIGQTYIFRAEQEGTFTLQFYRRDFIRDESAYDYVKLIIGTNNETHTTADIPVEAPLEIDRGINDETVTQELPQNDPSVSTVISLADYITNIQTEFDGGRVEVALLIMDNLRQSFPEGNDEVWWLYAQLLEANSPRRDIQGALDSYQKLIREYPQSSRVSEARRRIAYLERFFLNIR